MPNYKLTYFNAYGRSEITRWCFAYGGIPYTDERIDIEKWPTFKKELISRGLVGEMPILTVDNRELHESLAIARYIAKMAGLVPKDPLEAAVADACVDSLAGIGFQFRKMIRNNKPLKEFFPKTIDPSGPEFAEQRQNMEGDFGPNVIYPVLRRLELQLQDKKWLTSHGVSWADLLISQQFGFMRRYFPELLDEYPSVQTLVDRVRNIDSIKKWISARPHTNM
ncbi:unnamed protein product [Meganyctiphanes norvegica]|uniref:glutathione transferase n=1 Tax=Meganyctiphanes norvegica TaxID=48144 RepID=A0AAV2QJW4_MEGNR